jgi:hypothetical protein
LGVLHNLQKYKQFIIAATMTQKYCTMTMRIERAQTFAPGFPNTLTMSRISLMTLGALISSLVCFKSLSDEKNPMDLDDKKQITSGQRRFKGIIPRF